MLILLFLIGTVSANDINTTEISTSDIDDVSSAVGIDLTDENYDNGLVDESTDVNNSELLTESSDSTIQNDINDDTLNNSNDNFNKENIIIIKFSNFRR